MYPEVRDGRSPSFEWESAVVSSSASSSLRRCKTSLETLHALAPPPPDDVAEPASALTERALRRHDLLAPKNVSVESFLSANSFGRPRRRERACAWWPWWPR